MNDRRPYQYNEREHWIEAAPVLVDDKVRHENKLQSVYEGKDGDCTCPVQNNNTSDHTKGRKEEEH